MKIGWFILVNGAIGVVAFILLIVLVGVLMAKSNEVEMERMHELVNDDDVQSDMVYESWFGNPRIGQVLSLILFIFAWEFMAPYAVARIYQFYKRSKDH